MPAGLVGLMCAKAFGADAVAVTDIKPDNLDLAARLGADATVLLEPPGNPGEVRRRGRDAAQRQACALAPGPAGSTLRSRGPAAGPSPSHMGRCARGSSCAPPVLPPGPCAGTDILLERRRLVRAAPAAAHACAASRADV